MFTDIEGSTRLAQNYPEALPDLIARHHAILQQAIETNHGYVFQIVGDGFCAAFHTAPDALNAALTAQRSLQHEAWGAAPVVVRMGIHTGVAQAGAMDDRSGGYIGYLTLARTQAILSSAHGGQVLLSDPSAELVRSDLPEGVSLLDMGEYRLKGVMIPEHLWQLAAPDLRLEFPPLSSLITFPNNLPAQLNSFVGRQHELTQIKELLSDIHLLTLIGPGGTGKTRLAVQLAAELLPAFADGVWLVELAPLADPTLVLQTIAATLGLREIPGMSLNDLVTSYLRGKHLLLILDNCEHLVEVCARLADHLLHFCPDLKIIASSREALGIAGETVFRVPPLALPDSDCFVLETLGRCEAVQLFVERAVAVKSSFTLTEHNVTAVAQICERLDGIPLALELAAARVGMLTPEQIARRLDDRFRLLTGGSRTALPRQQTLRSTIDWSYNLLSEAERTLFCQLSVFVGGWTLEAAEAVCPELDVLELLAQLVHKSLVLADETIDTGTTRFRLLETIRQYGRDKLLEAGEAAQVRDRHLDYTLKFAEAGEPESPGLNKLEWLNQCELEHDNFRAALQWGLERNEEVALRLAGSLGSFWSGRNYRSEGRRWLQAALECVAALPEAHGEAIRKRQAAQAKGTLWLIDMLIGLGEYQAGLEACNEAVRLYRQLGDRSGLGFALSWTGMLATLQGDNDLAERALAEAILLGRAIDSKLILIFAIGVQSQQLFLPRGDIVAARAGNEESVRLAREANAPWAEAMGVRGLARVAAALGEWDEARRHTQEAAKVFREMGDRYVLNEVYAELAYIELHAGCLPEAGQLFRQCVAVWQEFGQRAEIARVLEGIAYIARAQNQPRRAAQLLGAAEALREQIGTPLRDFERIEYDAAVAWLHAQLDETTYHARWSEGRAMGMDQAIAYVLESSPPALSAEDMR